MGEDYKMTRNRKIMVISRPEWLKNANFIMEFAVKRIYKEKITKRKRDKR